jgi:hypothetical protein
MTERTVYGPVRERQTPTVRVAGTRLFPGDLLEHGLDERTDASGLASRTARTSCSGSTRTMATAGLRSRRCRGGARRRSWRGRVVREG